MFQEKIFVGASFLIQLQASCNFVKKNSVQVFSQEFCKTLRTLFFVENLLRDTSKRIICEQARYFTFRINFLGFDKGFDIECKKNIEMIQILNSKKPNKWYSYKLPIIFVKLKFVVFLREWKRK